MNRQLLEQPFQPEQIKQRDGSFGKTLDYIEGHAVIQRLNDAFDGNWSFEIISHDILDEEVVVQGKLSAGGIVKSQFGSSAITRARETGAAVSLAGDLKAAATDALKKCSTLLGVGLHLYSGHQSSQEPIYCGNPGNGGGYTGTGHKNGNGGNGSNGNGTTRITNKQLSYIVNLGQDIGLDSKGLDTEALEMFGVRLSYLTTKDASTFIDSLKRKAA